MASTSQFKIFALFSETKTRRCWFVVDATFFPYCSIASWLVLEMTLDSLLGETPAPGIKSEGVSCWELKPFSF